MDFLKLYNETVKICDKFIACTKSEDTKSFEYEILHTELMALLYNCQFKNVPEFFIKKYNDLNNSLSAHTSKEYQEEVMEFKRSCIDKMFKNNKNKQNNSTDELRKTIVGTKNAIGFKVETEEDDLSV